jgi:hypothetical protein
MNKFNFLNKDDFLKAKSEGCHYFFGNCDLDLFDWNDVISLFEDNYKKRDYIRHPRQFNNFGFNLFDASSIPIVKQFEEELKVISPHNEISSHIYSSFTSESDTLGFHKDEMDVIFWQVSGTTQFIVIDNYKEHTYNLLPNDILFIPKNTTHGTKTISPRVGVSLSL